MKYILTWRVMKARTLWERLEARSLFIWAEIFDLND